MEAVGACLLLQPLGVHLKTQGPKCLLPAPGLTHLALPQVLLMLNPTHCCLPQVPRAQGEIDR